MVRHVIYIPGIGDHHSYGQNIAIQLWRLFGLRPHYLPLVWNNTEGFAVKQKRILDLVDKLHSTNDSVSLVGVSAGASAVLNAFSKSHHVHKVICISGKINNSNTISKNTLEINSDFGESMALLPAALQTIRADKVLSIHPRKDQTVPIADTLIEGAEDRTLPGWSHASGIFFGVILGSLLISNFIKKE